LFLISLFFSSLNYNHEKSTLECCIAYRVFMQIYSFTEISFFKSEMHSFVAEAMFITAIRIHAAVIAGRYLVTHLK
jgi:hypothetical protein